MTTWKIGSRWGNNGTSVLDLFIDYGCLFFGGISQFERFGHWEEVVPGDLVVISDGATPVAIAQVLSKFDTYNNTGIKFTQRDFNEYIDAYVRICKAEIILLDENERNEYWGIDGRKPFCKHCANNPELRQKVENWWHKNVNARRYGEFNIQSHTWGLFDSENTDGSVFSQNIRYRIPIYQRPYSWEDNELRRLFEDLHQAVQNKEPVFMGTMQLSDAIPLDPFGKRKAYDLIDGQQRVTTFAILISRLQKQLTLDTTVDLPNNLRTIVNRGEAQRNMDEFWQYNEQQGEPFSSANPYVRNAITIDNLLEEYFDGKDGNPSVTELWDFLVSSIRFVVIETRAGLSKTLKIFNTINTAGMDLGVEDLFKVRFFEYRKWCGDQDDVFDKISDIYASVDVYKREHPERGLTMATLLNTYKRILVAKYHLNSETYNMGFERFYEMLFDTVLGVHIWSDFRECKDLKNLLTIEDFMSLLDCFKARHEEEGKDWNCKIMFNLLHDTRYGYAWDFNVIALFFKKISKAQLCEFSTKLFKLLVPYSLNKAKRVYKVDAELLTLLRKIASDSEIGVLELLDEYFDSGVFAGADMRAQLLDACTWEIAWYPKWKMLVCRLAEYLRHPNKDEELWKCLYCVPADIEHIQSYTDTNDRDAVWTEWGAELNRLGNLSMLEQTLNRSIQNKPTSKPDAYAKSCFATIQELKDKVGAWTKEDAEKRRELITNQLCDFILSK